MPSLDNLLRTINEYMKDMFDTFGGQSQEYMTALGQVKSAIPRDTLSNIARQGLEYDRDNPTEPLQIRRGIKAEAVFSEKEMFDKLEKLRAEQRQTGTAKVQAQRYYTEQQEENEEPSLEGLRQRAADRYDFNNNTNDWYKKITDSEYATEFEKNETRKLYKEMYEDYDDQSYREAVETWCTSVLDKMRQRQKDQNKTTETPKQPIAGVGADKSTLT